MVAAAADVPRYAGSPRDVGRAVGRALRPRLEANIADYLRRRPQTPDSLDLDELHRGAIPWLRGLPERFQAELEGLAEGAGLPLQLIAEWNYVEACVSDGCSAVVAMLGGHAWVARNNDMFVPGIWGHAAVREIDGRIPTLCFGQEGDVFTATGVNRERLWLHHQALTTTDAARPERLHMAGWVLLTDMLETCATIADVEARLLEVDRDEGMLLFAIEGGCDAVAILECGRSGHARRMPTGSVLAGTNHACVLKAAAGGDSVARQARMEQMATQLAGREGTREGTPSLPGDLVAILAADGVERRGRDFATVYSAVCCPATGELWFTFGGVPSASRGRWLPVAWPW
jgi:hypothetical protein